MCLTCERLPERKPFLLFFFSDNFRAKIFQCSHFGISHGCIKNGEKKNNGGAECNKQQWWEEADPLSTHRLTGQLGGSPHPFLNLFFNWSVKTVVLWTRRQGEALHSTPGPVACPVGWAGCMQLSCLTTMGGRHNCLKPQQPPSFLSKLWSRRWGKDFPSPILLLNSPSDGDIHSLGRVRCGAKCSWKMSWRCRRQD